MWGHEYDIQRRAKRRRAVWLTILAVLVLAIPVWLTVGFFSVSAADRQLLSAVRGGSVVGVIAALEAGANPNVRYRNGRSVLHEAAWRGHTSVVRRLVSAGADVNARDRRAGETPLHTATRAGRADMVVVLLGSGARSSLRTLEVSEPDIRGNRHQAGVTAREIAETSGFEDVAHALRGT